MDKAEAIRLLSKELEAYRVKTYQELISMIGDESITYEIKGSAGITWQIEIQAFWDDKPNGDVRILGSIDDGGWRSLAPVTDDFIKSSSGELIGE